MARAAAKNPFDLEAKDGVDRKYVARVWTEEEQKEKLKGYLEVPPENWCQVRNNTHVRYYTIEEGYKSGGFVLKNPFDCMTTEGEKRFIKLQNMFNPREKGYVCWLVSYDKLDKLYMKPDAATIVALHSTEVAVKQLNDNIRKIVEFTKRLDARVTALEKR